MKAAPIVRATRTLFTLVLVGSCEGVGASEQPQCCTSWSAAFGLTDWPCVQIPRGTHLTFMGSSLTRYQYIDLVYHLESGGNDVFAQRSHFNPLWEGTFASWPEFFVQTNADLHGHEACDCVRRRKTDPTSI